MRSHFVPACCNINNKGEHTLLLCVLLCVGLETRDKVSYLIMYFIVILIETVQCKCTCIQSVYQGYNIQTKE